MEKYYNLASPKLVGKPSLVNVTTEPSASCLNRCRLSWWCLTLIRSLLFLFCYISILSVSAQNAIVTENAKTGNPSSEWQISGAGDLSIQGFATDISYNKGETARFKIKTSARAFIIRVYRLGFYQGNGARFQGDATVTAALPQSQPNCLTNSSTGLLDCGNWAESASWLIPSTAVSGIYIAKLTRTDNGGSSHITFIVRDDASTSDLFFQTSDATWQAYNVYGDNNNGKSLYTGSGGKAAKVSYNRPFITRNGGGGGGAEEDWLFNAEYPMIRWIEANGYDVTYTTNVDGDRRGNLIKNHRVFLSVGHDEYWSGTHRAHVTAARDAGTSLAFFSGNEVYWKTRWENSIDGSGKSHRTLVCYKEGGDGENTCSGKCDPSSEWTGLWRSGCEYTTGNVLVDGCNPENELTGQISWELSDASLQVPSTYGNLRFWRNTSVSSLSSGQTASFTYGTIGYEWNSEQEQYRSTYPNGRIILSSTVINGKTHHLSLYKHSSGALVFGAGTVQYSWGLDSNHDRGNAAPSLAMQQATVNLFADMGVQPGSLRSGLVPASASTDTQAPSTTIASPAEGESLPLGSAVTISGTATDANVVAGVEVSTDGGNTWRLASGTTNWSYTWTPTASGAATIRSRAFDDSGNMSVPVIRNVTVGGTVSVNCPCTVFHSSSAPTGSLQNDGQALQLGMKFRSSIDGFVTGVRFYKQSGNTGTHTGQLYNSAGVLLASVAFSNETATGWQEAAFASPVAVSAGTTYVISYHSSAGNYSVNDNAFSQAIVNGPLTGLQNGVDGANGVYRYTSSPAFPTSSYAASNYWVDVVFNTSTSPGNQAPIVSITSPANNATFTAPASIAIAASASDADGTISKVEFFNSDTKLGEDTDGSDGWAFVWNSVPGGTYALTAKATDNVGAAASSAVVNITVSSSTNQVPTVSITSPANNATFTAPASVSIAATASDTDGTVSRVEFFNGDTKLGEDTSSPYSYTWGSVAAGSYQITARATDNAGAVATSAVVNITVNPAPSGCPCTVFQPSAVPASGVKNDGMALQIGMKFQSTENGLVTGIRFYKHSGNTGTHTGQLYSSSGILLASVTFTNETASGWQEAAFASPVAVTAGTTYVISYHSGAGNYTSDYSYFNQAVSNGPLKALANGESGANGVYRYTSTPAFPTSDYQASNYWIDVVFNMDVPPANQPPTVSLTSPANNATFTAPASVAIAASASDADGTVAKVEFFQGNTKLGEDLSSPYTFAWNGVAAGSYQLTARATDNGGAASTSTAVAITVVEPANLPPTVSLTSPANNATFTAPANIELAATAADQDGSITRVEFYSGGTKIGEDLTSPYTYSWGNVAAGTYQLTARAFDNLEVATISTVVNITVNSASLGCPCTVFQPSAVPASAMKNDRRALQVGMKFQASVNGYVTGVRFYKHSGNTGTHTGQLYSSSGTLLASVVFSNETATGWQEQAFALPVAVTAGTTYVISYHSSAGNYTSDYLYFSQAVSNGPLRALANGESSVNGVYRYTSSPAFPSNGYRSSNYWVDVVFDSNLAATSVSSLEQADLEEAIIVYPNPFSGKATVILSLLKTGEYTVELYDVKGAMIETLKQGKAVAGKLEHIEIDGNKFPKGWYILKLKSQDYNQSTKLLNIK
ncbi:DUF4082 domain-containing protein [Pontibacter virosus]|uniref:Putative secreted protein (Por secretion system target) n=1 Tax=Pontibacter virosus TaxID=1765052 RepID=A0A2U1AW47_9BACT|nr:DUF4082 domain-containing protein [Pontibacter virosus]PVY40665.1 putative secreted protein (Por secretion system target) [Pontibacter virosus]